MKLLKGNNPHIKRKSQQAIFQRKQSKNDKNNVNKESFDSIDKGKTVNTQSISRRQRIRESRRDELKQQQHDLMMRPNKVDTTIAPASVTNNNTEQKKKKRILKQFLIKRSVIKRFVTDKRKMLSIKDTSVK